MKRIVCILSALILMLVGVSVSAQSFDADMASAWLQQLVQLLDAASLVNDPAMTADPARAGERLYAYDFGTVTVQGDQLTADAILEVEIRGEQMEDCRGVRTGMGMYAALDAAQPSASATQLYVLGIQESGLGWSWAYVSDEGVYGIEYISYGADDLKLREYTLTYIIDDGIISAIRLRTADAAQAQAEQAMATALEIMNRQHGEICVLVNQETALACEDLRLKDHLILGQPVVQMIAAAGEPSEIQTLPEGRGRIIVYDGIVAELDFREETGEEIVTGVTVSTGAVTGPRGVTAGMSVQEASALFRCDQEISAMGGVLYLDGEAKGEPPYAELIRETTGKTLRYVCLMEDRQTARLDLGIQDDSIAYWHMYIERGENELAK